MNFKQLTVYTYEVRLVNSRCLHNATLTVYTIARVYLSGSPSQLALFVRLNSRVRSIAQMRCVHSYFLDESCRWVISGGLVNSSILIARQVNSRFLRQFTQYIVKVAFRVKSRVRSNIQMR